MESRKAFTKKVKAPSIKVNETPIKGCQFTLGLKVLKKFGLIGVLEIHSAVNDWTGLKIASGSEKKKKKLMLQMFVAFSFCVCLWNSCGTSLSYSNILCGDHVLWEKHFPGISNMLDGGRWWYQLPVQCGYSYTSFPSPQSGFKSFLESQHFRCQCFQVPHLSLWLVAPHGKGTRAIVIPDI